MYQRGVCSATHAVNLFDTTHTRTSYYPRERINSVESKNLNPTPTVTSVNKRKILGSIRFLNKRDKFGI